MTYPESAAVSAGDATLASHYNNLRLDALHLGKAAADAVALGTLLERYESRLEVERLNTTKIRVPASASAPVSLLIDGYLCQAVANVDLDAGDVPAGGAAAYYIFANRIAASTTFTLTVNTVSTEAASQRRIGRFYWDGSMIIKDSVRSEFAKLIADLLYFVDPQVCGGRMTLSTGVPVTDSDISSSATVYFAPFVGNRISLYVQDYGWRLYTFPELTLDISGIAPDKNIDVWLYDNAGTLTLAYTEWSNATLRATALVRQDGVLVKSGSPAYRYLGSVRTSGSGVTCDTKLKRFLWNYYNRLPRLLEVLESTGSWIYNTATWRSSNNSIANRVQFIIGVSEKPVFLEVHQLTYDDPAHHYARYVGIGLDKTNGTDANLSDYVYYGGSYPMHPIYRDFPGIGFHYLQWVEKGTASSNSYFFGDDGNPTDIQFGMIGEILG